LAFALLLGRLVAAPLLLGRLVAAPLLHRSGPAAAVLPGLASGEVPGKRATEDVRLLAGLEARQSHEQDKDHGTRNGEWQMVAKNTAKSAATQVTAGARPIRRSGGWLRTHSGLPCVSRVWSRRRILRMR
jgi:hypothetical protein